MRSAAEKLRHGPQQGNQFEMENRRDWGIVSAYAKCYVLAPVRRLGSGRSFS